MHITRSQCRAGRALLDWTQEQLAEAAGLGVSTIETFENGKSRPHARNRQRIREALEAGGIHVIDAREASLSGGPGVRERNSI